VKRKPAPQRCPITQALQLDGTCQSPSAVPGPVGVPPGFTAVPDPADVYPEPITPGDVDGPDDPCFRQDPECYVQPR
jgi:hypothetical protein